MPRIVKVILERLLTVHRVRRSFVEGGLDGALVRRPVPRRPRLLDGEQEAHLIALACGSPPAGRCRWTLRLLAEKLVVIARWPEPQRWKLTGGAWSAPRNPTTGYQSMLPS